MNGSTCDCVCAELQGSEELCRCVCYHERPLADLSAGARVSLAGIYNVHIAHHTHSCAHLTIVHVPVNIRISSL